VLTIEHKNLHLLYYTLTALNQFQYYCVNLVLARMARTFAVRIDVLWLAMMILVVSIDRDIDCAEG